MGVKKICLIIALMVLFHAGCATPDDVKPAASPSREVAVEAKAKIIFVRPSSHGGEVLHTIIDDKGTFVGESAAHSRFETSVDSGEHLFIGWGTNTVVALKAIVEGGKTYWVYVDTKMEFDNGEPILSAVKRNSDKWNSRTEWMKDTDLLVANMEAGQAHIDSYGEEVEDAIKRGREAYQNYSEEDKVNDATLEPEDGE